MAGSYPDVPSRRMAVDADGSVFVYRENLGFPLTELTGASVTELNDEDNTTVLTLFNNQAREYMWIFPELREFDGMFIGATGNSGGSVWGVSTSGDTTNGIDGTFTQRAAPAQSNAASTYSGYRGSTLKSYAVSNVRCVRGNMTDGNDGSLQSMHVYGEIAAGETPDRLLWFDNDDDLEFSKPQDYGDKPRGSAEDHVVYLKNNSASLTASSVQITAEDLYLGSGGWFTFSEGGAFSGTLALASSIANGTNSPDITVRCIRPDAAQLGLHAARVYANTGSWA